MTTNAAIRLIEEPTAGAHDEKTSDQRRKRITNVVHRANGVYYFQALIGGKRYFESLQTSDRKVAAARAKMKRAAIEGAKWEALSATRVKAEFATVGEVCDAYAEIVRRHGTVRPGTVTANVAALLRIVEQTTGNTDPRSVRTTVLTGALANRYGQIRMEARGDDAMRRSVASNLRQARSVVRRKLWEDYKQAGVRLPDCVHSFDQQFVTRAPKKRYEMPPATLYTPTIEAGRKLEGTLGMIWTLAYDLGMRAGEIAAVRWSWFEEDVTPAGTRIWLSIRARDGWAPKGTSGRVPVFPGVWAKLAPLRGADDATLIPGPTENAREDLVKRDFAEWMRGLGWTTRMCAHELRKLRGSWWFARYGVERAYKWLRHANIQTTLDSYADLPRQVEPEWIEAPGPEWADQIGKAFISGGNQCQHSSVN